MKDAYSFDVSEEKAVASYELMREAYVRVFTRLGLEFRLVSADSGAMGGSTSAEFQVLAQNGEDAIVACTKCQYAANVEVATTTAPAKFAGAVAAPEKVATPGKKTIEEVAAFLKVPASETLKALFYRVIGDAGVSYAICFVRGDHTANEVKLLKALRDAGVSAKEVVMGEDAELQPFGGVAGYMGPVGLTPAKNLTVLVDREGATGAGFVVGANEAGFHTKNVAFGRDFTATVCDVRQVGDGDACPSCGGALKSYRGIEGGHIFVLGTHYSAKMKCTFLDEQGQEKPIVMGCYGIGVSRLVATAIEQHHDQDGIVWPMSIAPFHVALVTAGKEPELTAAAKELYAELTAAGVEVLFDDRDERPGVKFKDADLLGLPIRIVVGKKSLAEGKVEIKARSSKTADLVAVGDAPANVVARIEAAGVRLVRA
jgi:prolyl-tRNA synthetase